MPYDQPFNPVNVADAQSADMLFSYWSGLRKSNSLPRRDDIDPNATEPFLPDILLLQRTDCGASFVRVAGAQTDALFGTGLRRTALEDFLSPDDGLTFQSFFDELLTFGQRGALYLQSAQNVATLTFFPLRNSNGVVDLAMVHVDSAPSSGKQINAFEISGLFLSARRRRDKPVKGQLCHLRLVVDNSV